MRLWKVRRAVELDKRVGCFLIGWREIKREKKNRTVEDKGKRQMRRIQRREQQEGIV